MNSQPILNSSSSTLASVGGADQQHASGGSNVIASQKVNGGRRRGSKRRGSKRRGGQGLTEIAVPALLLTANHLYGRKTQSNNNDKKRFSRRRSLSRRRRSFGRRR
jgi:hypothetical protein